MAYPHSLETATLWFENKHASGSRTLSLGFLQLLLMTLAVSRRENVPYATRLAAIHPGGAFAAHLFISFVHSPQPFSSINPLSLATPFFCLFIQGIRSPRFASSSNRQLINVELRRPTLHNEDDENQGQERPRARGAPQQGPHVLRRSLRAR